MQTNTVLAAPAEFPLGKSNSWSFSAGGGTYEYTIPYTGDYTIVVAGAQGSSYGGSGGTGYTLTKTVRLNYGDVVKCITHAMPTSYQDGQTYKVPGGESSELYVNGTLVWRAGGGGGYVNTAIAPNNTTTVIAYNGNNDSSTTYNVHWHSGNGKSGPVSANTFPTLYQLTAPASLGCYRDAGHTHNATSYCPLETCMVVFTGGGHYYGDGCGWHGYEDATNYYAECTLCGASGTFYSCPGDHTSTPPYKTMAHIGCDKSGYKCNWARNTWSIQCGYQHGQIVGYNNANATVAPCYYATGWNPTTAVVNNTGTGKFAITLTEHTGLYYNNAVARIAYLNAQVPLVVKDRRVVYFKR